MNEPLRFVHLSDTHIGPAKDFELYGNVTWSNAEQMVAAINALPAKPDFVINTGDIVAFPDRDAYKLAGDLFAKLQSPVYWVAGNHDSPLMVRSSLAMGEKRFSSDDTGILSYAFELKGIRCVVLDARGPDEIDPHGVLKSHQLDFLQSELSRDPLPMVIFVHFPPLKLDSMWLDESMLLLNGPLLHEMLVPARDRVRGVFFGHVHRGMQVLKDGILYSSVASTGGQFFSWPDDKRAVIDSGHPPCFNFVTVFHDQTIVKEHSIPRH